MAVPEAEIVSVLIDTVLSKLHSLVSQNDISRSTLLFPCSHGFKSPLDKLILLLEQIDSQLICPWRFASRDVIIVVHPKSSLLLLKQVEEIVSHAELLVDKLAYLVLKHKMKHNCQLLHNSPSMLNVQVCRRQYLFSWTKSFVAFGFKLAYKFKVINSSLNQILLVAVNINQRLSIPPVTLLRKNIQPADYNIGELILDQTIIGRESDVSNLVGMLVLSSDNVKELQVISIVGMAGQGKTSLAQLVYDNDVVERYFDERVWVTVSDCFDVDSFLIKIMQLVSQTISFPSMFGLDGLKRNLEEKLSEKRCLLVLDDVHEGLLEGWDIMSKTLLGMVGSRGSKIMITTRSEVVVAIMKASPYRLGKLSKEDSWTLFEQKTFARGGDKTQKISNFVSIGEKIVEKCDGMPLALNIVGALMHSIQSEEECLSIEKSSWKWSLVRSGRQQLLPLLQLSYNHLFSSSLKQCFAFCSFFPKNTVFEKEKLIQLWMAQDWLHSSQGSHMMMEDVGDYYLSNLLRNSMLHDAKKDIYGDIITCKMHDLVHDLALDISQDRCATLETGKVNDISKVVHLSSISCENKLLQSLRGSYPKLRTLYLVGCLVDTKLTRFKYLRVLILENADIEELPHSVSELKYLRYLDISKTEIQILPESITRLCNLQTLRLKTLRELPQKLVNLVNLRHLHLKNTKESRECMLIGIGQLTSIQTLPFFVVNQHMGCHLEELKYLNCLGGELSIFGLEDVKDGDEARRAHLFAKTNIRSLVFHWIDSIYGRNKEQNYSDEDVLEGLTPHPNLKGLTLENFRGGKFACWMTLKNQSLVLHNLMTVRLVNCNEAEQLPALGHLPCLKIIEIEVMMKVKHIGEEFYSHRDTMSLRSYNNSSSFVWLGATVNIFPSLKKLRLWHMENLEQWFDAMHPSPSMNVFPCLETLDIYNCPKLLTVPSQFPSLKNLIIKKIDNCQALEKMSSKLTSLAHLSMENVRGSNINYIVKKFLGNNKHLRDLEVVFCEGLSYIPKGTGNLLDLESLELRGCSNLTVITDEMRCLTSLRLLKIADCYKLTCLPEELQAITSLESMCIQGCPNLLFIPMLHGLSSLHNLKIKECKNLTCLPEGLEYLVSLESIEVRGCPNLMSITDTLFPSSLRRIKIIECEKLTYFPEGHQTLVSLESLDIGRCHNLMLFPDTYCSTSLRTLHIANCENLTCLPTGLESCTSLYYLSIQNCPSLLSVPCLQQLLKIEELTLVHCGLRGLPDGLHLLTGLRELEIGGFWEELDFFPWPSVDIDDMPNLFVSLKRLTLRGWPKLRFLPDQLQYLTGLVFFSIENFDGLEVLSEWLEKLSSLEYLCLINCEKLMFLPSEQAMQRLNKLCALRIISCPLLKHTEWHKISHIPGIDKWKL